MKSCPQCGKSYGTDDRFCTVDGATLVAAAREDHSSLIGTVLADRYLVQQRLGEGGMGEVYLAEHVRIKRKVAVKLMRAWMKNDPLAVSRFHREAENASQISHPNVAQVYDFGETTEGTIYLAMEFVPGEPLSSILEREGRLHTVRAAEIVRQTAEALVAAHAMGILHRDLKPDNIMISTTRVGTDVVKLVDFGIARVMSRGTQQFTSTGMIVGTPDYMSPEQLTGDPLDERSDIYALALIAFRVLTGQSAFKSAGSTDALLARLMNKPATLAEVRPDVEWPEALQASFYKALNSDPALRHADPLEFAAEFDGAVAQLPLTEEEQSYLILLSQRSPTPTRGSMSIDGATPVRAMSAIARGDAAATPNAPRAAVGLVTPPNEAPSLSRPGIPAEAITSAPYTPTPTSEFPPVPPSTPSAASVASTGEQDPAGAHGPADTPARASVGPPASVALPVPAAPDATSTRSGGAEAPAMSARGGRRLVPVAVVGLLAVAALAFVVSRRSAATPDAAPTVVVNSDSLAAAAVAAADSSPATAVPAAPTWAADSARVQRARGSVLGVATPDGRGSAFVVDGNGLLLTSASLVPADQRVDLFVDADHTVRATVVSVNAQAGIAALLIAPGSCKRCQPLDLGADDSTKTVVADGDTLLAFPVVRRNSVTPQVAVVARAAATTFATATPLGPTLVGAPLLSARSGSVSGLVTRRRGTLAVATASTLRALVAQARIAATRLTPNDTIYRTWPLRAVPVGDIAAAEGRSIDLSRYRVTQDGYDVLAMTPHVLAWRLAKSAPPAAEDNPFAIPAATKSGPPDPLLDWTGSRLTRQERRAVVVFVIGPDKAAFPENPERPLDARKGDFYSMTLTRDGTPLVPLESQRIAAVGNRDLYRRERKAMPNAGVYVFHPADFASSTSAYRMDIVDADTKRRVTVALPPAMLQSIASDLAPWQR